MPWVDETRFGQHRWTSSVRQVITASITNEAIDDLKLAKGQKADAVIKASDVMISIA